MDEMEQVTFQKVKVEQQHFITPRGWSNVDEIEQVTFGKTIRVLSYLRQLLLWACVS